MHKNMLAMTAFLASLAVSAQEPAKGPVPFEKFHTKEMKTIDGDFPVYQRGNNYYIEIPAASLNKDVLVIGYAHRGSAAVAKSSGIIRFSKGVNNHLDVTRPVFNEGASGDVNGDMDPVISKSTKKPVNYGYKIEAKGKQKDSYIIDITRQITDAGEWFGFSDLTFLSRPDPKRSFVQRITPEKNGVSFIVERSQTDYMGNMGASNKIARNTSYEIALLFTQLPEEKMRRKEAEGETGFSTISYMDYGKTPYTVRNTRFIRKWNIRPGKKRSGGLIAPARKLKVVIDPVTPGFYRKYIREGILAWNKAFNAAGYQDVLEVEVDSDLNLAPGKISVNWGNAHVNVLTATVDHPETGEIITARMNLTADVVNELMLKYLVQCHAVDNRITRDIRDRNIAGEIIRWKVMRGMGEILGLQENPGASTKYTPEQLRNAGFLKANGMSASIMDDLEFNYLAQPGDQVPVEELMPRIGVDDIAAIKWAYGQHDEPPAYTWLPEKKSDAFLRRTDLSSDPVAASTLGIGNLEKLYPRLKEISKMLDGSEDLFNANGSLYGAVQREYKKYVTDVLEIIGGIPDRGTPHVSITGAEQRKAMAFLSRYVFSGMPAWMNVRMTHTGRLIDNEMWLQSMREAVLNRLLSPQVLAALAAGEEKEGKNAFTTAALFDFIDKAVFMSFDKMRALTPTERATQLNFIYQLSQAAFKSNITSGLSDGNVLLHYYLTSTIRKITEMSTGHTDLLTRENYRLMKIKADKEFFSKIKV